MSYGSLQPKEGHDMLLINLSHLSLHHKIQESRASYPLAIISLIGNIIFAVALFFFFSNFWEIEKIFFDYIFYKTYMQFLLCFLYSSLIICG